MRLPIAILFVTVLSAERTALAQQTELGVLNGALYRITVPTTWNGTVVIVLPGYSDKPAKFDTAASVGALAEHLVQEGTLYAEAGYHAGGWAVAEALDDVERLRDHLAARFGAPKRVVLMGESMGGMIALALVERNTVNYQGGLAFCSGTISAYDYFKRGAFDVLIMFEALFPSTLPPVDGIPTSFQPSEQVIGSVMRALEGNREHAAILQAAVSVSDPASMAELLVFHLDALRELAVRAGGNPFDNTKTEYPALVRDGKRIAQARRVQSLATAERYVRRFYTPTGSLRVPFLAVNVTSDPVVPRWATNAYPPTNRWFVQQYVDKAGHCGVTTEQRAGAFDALKGWMERGSRPPQKP